MPEADLNKVTEDPCPASEFRKRKSGAERARQGMQLPFRCPMPTANILNQTRYPFLASTQPLRHPLQINQTSLVR